MFRLRLRCLAPLAAGLLWLGCISPVGLHSRLDDHLVHGDFEGAAELVGSSARNRYGEANRLLFHLERGLLLQAAGRDAASAEAFDHAALEADALYTKSLGRAGGSLFVNDLVLAYEGDPYEHTLLHVFAALGYARSGRLESAAVEARRLSDRLRKRASDQGRDSDFADSAFGRYLAGMLYEARGERERALLEYRKASTAYRARGRAEVELAALPDSLARRTGRLAARLGRDQTGRDGGIVRVAARRSVHPAARARESGEIVLIHLNGLAPRKGEVRFTVPFSDAWWQVADRRDRARGREAEELDEILWHLADVPDADVVAVAFPELVSRPYRIRRMRPRLPGAIAIDPPELVEDVGALADAALEARIDGIRAKAIARAALKLAVQKALEHRFRDEGGDRGELLFAMTRLGGSLARLASERADTRSWTSLPDTLWLSTVTVPPGRHALEVEFVDKRGGLVEHRRLQPVDVAAGERHFLIVRTVQ